eukprot:10089-Heterococcus_DN1.PRE.3
MTSVTEAPACMPQPTPALPIADGADQEPSGRRATAKPAYVLFDQQCESVFKFMCVILAVAVLHSALCSECSNHARKHAQTLMTVCCLMPHG